MTRGNCKISLVIFCIFFQLSINYGCQRHPGRQVTDKEFSIITESCSKQGSPVSLYYLDGDCSFCLLKAKEFDDKKVGKDTGSILLFKASNPIMVKMYIQGISLRSCVILDSNNLFSKSFVLNSRYEISEKGEILSERSDK